MAAAVNPDAFSSLSGAPQTQLNIGKSIFYSERINTTGSGLVQVLLVDGSTFTVGPGSDLVIDKFVYDPKKGVGQISASFSKGVMRFVGGKISKNEGGVTVNTPAGALAIRGGIAYVDFKSSQDFQILFVFGDSLQLQGQPPVFQFGNGYFGNNGQTVIKPFTAAHIQAILASLTNNSGGVGGKPPDPPKPSTLATIFATQSLNQLLSDVNTEMIVADANDALTNQPTTPQEPATPQEPGEQPCQVDCQGLPPGNLQGYTGGLYSQNVYENENDLPVGVLANWNSKHVDFKFHLDETGSPDYFSADFKLRVGMPGDNQGGVDISFGGPEYSFIGQNGFAALSPPDGIKFFRDGLTPATPTEDIEPFALLASSGLFDFGDVPDRPTLPTFCSDCDFLEWGFFYAQGSFEDPQGGNPPTVVSRNVSVLGWWAGGDIQPVGQLPLTGGATYSGDAIATVSTNLFATGYNNYTNGYTSGWTTYVATGDLDMDWNFGTRSGTLTISKFDASHFPANGGLSFAGSMCAPDVTSCGTNTPGGNHFGGALSGTLPDNWQRGEASGQIPTDARNLDGFALGSFARGEGQVGRSIPQGVIGNWGVGNDHYMASGIFAGPKVTPTQ